MRVVALLKSIYFVLDDSNFEEKINRGMCP